VRRDAIPARYRDKCRVQLEVGIDDPGERRIQPRPRENGRFRVLYVGRLVYPKGVHLGLAALARLRTTHPEATFTIIGSGPDEAWLRRAARHFGVADAVNWIPQLDRAGVMRAYAGHDAFLYPSLHESSADAVLEALSGGLPGPSQPAAGSPATRPALLAPGEWRDGWRHCGRAVRIADTARAVDGRRGGARASTRTDREVARMEQLYRTALRALPRRRGHPVGRTVSPALPARLRAVRYAYCLMAGAMSPSDRERRRARHNFGPSEWLRTKVSRDRPRTRGNLQ
jgi:hypothetical protein